MSESRTWARHGALLGGIALMVVILASVCVRADDSHGTCNNATLRGTYVYAYTGYSGTGSTLTRFAVAGLAVFNGDGTSHGVWTTATEGQPVARLGTFQGKYSVSFDCSATEVDTDQNGNVYHYDDFTGPGGKEISFIQTDPNVVSSGIESRTQKSPHH
jgi:hypothetical protein